MFAAKQSLVHRTCLRGSFRLPVGWLYSQRPNFTANEVIQSLAKQTGFQGRWDSFCPKRGFLVTCSAFLPFFFLFFFFFLFLFFFLFGLAVKSDFGLERNINTSASFSGRRGRNSGLLPNCCRVVTKSHLPDIARTNYCLAFTLLTRRKWWLDQGLYFKVFLGEGSVTDYDRAFLCLKHGREIVC